MIHPPYEVFYIESMLTATNSALESVDRLNNCIKTLSPTNHQEVIDNTLNIINQAAALSRYLWPSKSSFKLRGQFLRQKLSIQDSNTLKARNIRNFIEHFDENLDTFCKNPIAGTIIPLYVGRYQLTNNTFFYFRAYFTDKGVFHTLGKNFEMQTIVEEIEKLHNHLIELSENGGRFK